MEDAAADSTADTIDIAPTVPTAPIAADKAKPKGKDKKELTAAKREVQNQKRQDRRVAKRARKVEVLAVIALEEKNEHLVLLYSMKVLTAQE
jgi:hypothetical protein